MLVTPRPDGQALTATDGGGRLSERGLSMWAFCDPHADSGADGGNRDPGTSSGCPTNPDRSRARQLSIAWNGPALVRAEPARAERDVRRFAALTLRAGVDFQDTARNPAGRAPDFDVTLLDDRGHRRTARAGDWSDAMIPPPGTVDRELTLSGIRIPLRAFRGVDLGHLRAVELQFGAAAPTGAVQLAELGFQ
jgi:hypothetical protein